MSNQSRAAAKAAGRAVDVSADDFDDSAAPENAAQEEDREPIAENED